MVLATNDLQSESGACLMNAADVVRRILSQHDDLVLPKHKRMFVQYETGEAGTTELNLYYGAKTVSFDDPDLFPFGEALAKTGSVHRR